MKNPLRHLIVLALICLPLSAQATEVKEVTSPGGINAWLVEEHALPLVSVKIAFRDAGSAYDPKAKQGLSTMLSAMMMEGAGDMDSHAFNEALENHAIQLNFGTDEDLLRSSVESMSEHRDKAFSYLAMALSSPRFDDAALARVRSQILSMLEQQEREPAYIVRRHWEKAAYGEHPYGYPSLGTKESVAAIGKDDLRDFVHRHVTRENMLIAVVGDVTPEELSRLLDTHLGKLPQRYAGDKTVADVKLPAQASQQVIDNGIPQTMVLFGAGALKREDPKYYAAYVMNEILGGSGALTSKLGIELRERRGLVYSVYTQMNPMTHSAYWRGGFATRNEKAGTALDVLRTTLKDFSDKGPTDQELKDAISHSTGAFVLGLDSNGDIASYLISMQRYGLGKDYLAKRNEYISAVTKDDVKAVAKALADPSQLTVMMVGKPNLAVDTTQDKKH